MALIETLIDNFDENTITALWALSGPGTPANQIKCQNNRLELTSDAISGDYFTISSASLYDLTSSYVKIQLINAGSQATNFDCIPLLVVNGTNELWWDINGNTMTANQKVSGVSSGIGSSATYNSSIHRWLRIRELSGTTFFEYSTDGRAWFNFTNTPNPITVTALAGGVQVGQFGTASASTFVVDNFNWNGRLYINNPNLRPYPFSPGLAR